MKNTNFKPCETEIDGCIPRAFSSTDPILSECEQVCNKHPRLI